MFQRLEKTHPSLYFFLDLAINVIIIVVLVYGVRTYLISPFQVYGPSMCDTLNFLKNSCQNRYGEYLIVQKWYSQPERGDIIVFRPPHNEDDFYIKRIIGLPGETVKIQNGKVYVINKENPKGMELPEAYLNKNNKNQTYPLNAPATATFEVTADQYFVLGDNRKKSTDSRTCFRSPGDRECGKPEQHLLKKDRIEGKAWVVLWPFSKMRLLEEPAYGI